MKKFKLNYLKKLSTIHSGHFDNLKIETTTRKVWLSRMTKADGMPYDNQVTIEAYDGEKWTTIKQYQAL